MAVIHCDGSYGVTQEDFGNTYVCDVAMTLELPPPSTPGANRGISIVALNACTLRTLEGGIFGATTVDGAVEISEGSSVQVVGDGSDWYILGVI